VIAFSIQLRQRAADSAPALLRAEAAEVAAGLKMAALLALVIPHQLPLLKVVAAALGWVPDHSVVVVVVVPVVPVVRRPAVSAERVAWEQQVPSLAHPSTTRAAAVVVIIYLERRELAELAAADRVLRLM